MASKMRGDKPGTEIPVMCTRKSARFWRQLTSVFDWSYEAPKKSKLFAYLVLDRGNAEALQRDWFQVGDDLRKSMLESTNILKLEIKPGDSEDSCRIDEILTKLKEMDASSTDCLFSNFTRLGSRYPREFDKLLADAAVILTKEKEKTSGGAK